MCILCESDHRNHTKIFFSDIQSNKQDLLKDKKELRNAIDKLKNNIDGIKNILNKILINIEIYYNINKDLINNYDSKKKNYYILKNINKIKEGNKNIIEDLNNINNEKDFNLKFSHLMEIYENLNYEYKKEIYENDDIYIGEFKNNKRNGKGIMYYNNNDKDNLT